MTSTLGEHIRLGPRWVCIPLPPIGTQHAYGEAFRKLSEFARTLCAAHDLVIDFVRDMIDATAAPLGETACGRPARGCARVHGRGPRRTG
jgi:hypothetical protein